MATRLIRLEDALLLAELFALNREFLAPWEPTRPDEQCTADGQRRQIEDALARHAADAEVPYVILEHGTIVGRVTLSNVVRAPVQSCNLGHWATFRKPGPSSIVSVAAERFRPDADSGAAAGEPTVLRAGRWGFAYVPSGSPEAIATALHSATITTVRLAATRRSGSQKGCEWRAIQGRARWTRTIVEQHDELFDSVYRQGVIHDMEVRDALDVFGRRWPPASRGHSTRLPRRPVTAQQRTTVPGRSTHGRGDRRGHACRRPGP